MTEAIDIIFYVAPFVFVAGGFAMGWVLHDEYERRKKTKELKKMGDDYND